MDSNPRERRTSRLSRQLRCCLPALAMTSVRVALSAYTTLGLGGPAGRFIEATGDDELVALVRAADQAGEPLLVLGGGSNLVVADDGFPGTVIHVATKGVMVSERNSPNGAGSTASGPSP